MYSSGRRGAPAKGVGRVTGAVVQIHSSPPKQKKTGFYLSFFVFVTDAGHLTSLCAQHKCGAQARLSRSLLASGRRAVALFACKKPPLISAKKFDKFRLVEFFYPLRKQWYIITTQAWISSPKVYIISRRLYLLSQ